MHNRLNDLSQFSEGIRPMAMKTQELLDALHAHYIKPEDRLASAGAGAVFLTEVTAPDDSGRRADALHVGLWQSRGIGEIDVCELKTSRADWRRELDNPAKAEAWWPYSTRFWVVAPSVDVVPADEIPDGWGLMVPPVRGRRFRTVVKPAVREPRLSIGLLLTLIKSTETVRTNQLRQQSDQMHAQHYREKEDLRNELSSTADPRSQQRLEQLADLEKALGFKVGSNAWRGQVEPVLVGEALAGYVRDETSRAASARAATEELGYTARTIEQTAKQLSEAAAELRKLGSRPLKTSA